MNLLRFISCFSIWSVLEQILWAHTDLLGVVFGHGSGVVKSSSRRGTWTGIHPCQSLRVGGRWDVTDRIGMGHWMWDSAYMGTGEDVQRVDSPGKVLARDMH